MIEFTIGKYDRLSSTNNFLNQLSEKENCKEGLVVTTDNQTNGRGYAQNVWESEPYQNLIFSLLLKPDFLSAESQFYLSMIVSLALADSCKSIIKSNDIKIKWPNDIYYQNSKLAGILIENSISGKNISKSIVGIGLNINQLNFSQTIPNPISLQMILDKKIDLDFVLATFLNQFKSRYTQLKNQELSKIKDEYLASMYLINQKSEFWVNDKNTKGEIIGINSFGQLKVMINNKINEFSFKEIEYIIPK